MSIQPAYVALFLAAALAGGCAPMTPPAESASAVTLQSAPPAPERTPEPSPSDAARERERLVYPFNLPQYDDVLASELEKASGGPVSGDASSLGR